MICVLIVEILEGQEAVDEGLIDSVGTMAEAMDYLYEMIEDSSKE